jgi:hypothetical protein
MFDIGGLLSDLLAIIVDFFVGLTTDGLTGFLRGLLGVGDDGDDILA